MPARHHLYLLRFYRIKEAIQKVSGELPQVPGPRNPDSAVVVAGLTVDCGCGVPVWLLELAHCCVTAPRGHIKARPRIISQPEIFTLLRSQPGFDRRRRPTDHFFLFETTGIGIDLYRYHPATTQLPATNTNKQLTGLLLDRP